MAYDKRLVAKTTTGVDRRLRLLALLQQRTLSDVITTELDKALPPADELLGLLGQLQETAAAS
jgi:hypothetical protein